MLRWLLVLLGAVGVFAAARWSGADWGLSLLIGVTAFYAGLVGLQVYEMGLQRKQQVADRTAEQESKRAKLELLSFRMARPYFRLADEHRHIPKPEGRVGIQYAGRGCYTSIPLRNAGPAMAHSCQPVVTAVTQRANGKWTLLENWIPLGLRWVFFDEANEMAARKPAEERRLVPERLYLFSLGKTSSQDPGHFSLCTVLTPNGQPTSYSPGEYCFEVTVYSENAELVRSWYRVVFKGGFTDPFPNERLLSDVLEVEELAGSPMTAAIASAS